MEELVQELAVDDLELEVDSSDDIGGNECLQSQEKTF